MGRRTSRLVPVFLSAVAATGVRSAEAESAHARPAAAKTSAQDAPKPPANVSLALDAPTTRGPWTLRVTNDGDVPVTIVADARLLTLEVIPRGARAAEHCELPAEMRPQDDLGRPLVLPPKRTYAERFEPRLYCLESNHLDALAPSATVVARLGWIGNATHAPFEVAPLEGMESQFAPSRSLVAPPIALPDEPTPAPAQRELPEGRPVARVETALTLQTARSVDATSGSEITLPLTLVNKGHRSAIVRFRPETLAFEVLGPGGTAHCGWATLAAAPMPNLFTTLAPGSSTGLSVMLSEYCSATVFEHAGFYVVRASFDARKASGAEIGLRSFDGQVIATTPTLVRLRHGSHTEPLVRPRLQPATP